MSGDGYGFTSGFERALVAGLFRHSQLALKLQDVLDHKKLTDTNLATIAEQAMAYVGKYGRLPQAGELEEMLNVRVLAGNFTVLQLDGCLELLDDVFHDPPMGEDFLFTQVVERARKSAVWLALTDGLKNWVGGDYKQLAQNVMDAATLGEVAESQMIELFDNLPDRTAARLGPEVPRYPIGIPDIDDKIRGLAKGELGCILGAPKHGKSQFLGWIAMQACGVGVDVVYFSFEMGVFDLATRFDAGISGIEINDLRTKATEAEGIVTDFRDAGAGRIFIEQFPAGTVSTKDLHNSLLKLKARGITPGMIITDYGDLMVPEFPERENKRHESLGAVYTDLRRMAVKWNVPVWTASQATREALERNVVTMGDVAESFKKVQIVDLLLAICGTADERAANTIRVSIAACRFSEGNTTTNTMQTLFAKGQFVDSSLFSKSTI